MYVYFLVMNSKRCMFFQMNPSYSLIVCLSITTSKQLKPTLLGKNSAVYLYMLEVLAITRERQTQVHVHL